MKKPDRFVLECQILFEMRFQYVQSDATVSQPFCDWYDSYYSISDGKSSSHNKSPRRDAAGTFFTMHYAPYSHGSISINDSIESRDFHSFTYIAGRIDNLPVTLLLLLLPAGRIL